MQPESEPAPSVPRRRAWRGLALVLGLALVQRLLYLRAQPASDPFLDHPFVDGALYVDWARALAAGTWQADGAYYHAPLYPYFLSVLLRLGGDSLRAVFLVQTLLSLGTAAWLGLAAGRRFGETAGVATAALAAFYQPLAFFAATPMGETLALFLLAAGIALRSWTGYARRFGSGLLFGLAALARPNLLLVGAVFGLADLLVKRWRFALFFAAGAALAVLPVTLHNWSASGHLVVVSSNGGLTAYHGNGPGARGIYHAVPGFSGDPARQRAEATALARARSGAELDPVEADRYWGDLARAERLAHPLESARLFAWRLALAFDDHEHALDYDPLLDRNPWRPVLRWGAAQDGSRSVFLVPFALLFALAASAWARFGWRRSGSFELWGALAAAAATPVLFYVSSRYRLPLAALLTLPAGLGLAGLVGRAPYPPRRSRAVAAGVALLAAAASVLVPSQALAREGLRQSLSNRLGVLAQAGELAQAEATAEAALALGDSYELRFNLGYLRERAGRTAEAEDEYARAFALDPRRPEAARALGLLLAHAGRFQEAKAPLEAALASGPRDAEAWAALCAAYRELGDAAGLADALARAKAAGVELVPR